MLKELDWYSKKKDLEKKGRERSIPFNDVFNFHFTRYPLPNIYRPYFTVPKMLSIMIDVYMASLPWALEMGVFWSL